MPDITLKTLLLTSAPIHEIFPAADNHNGPHRYKSTIEFLLNVVSEALPC